MSNWEDDFIKSHDALQNSRVLSDRSRAIDLSPSDPPDPAQMESDIFKIAKASLGCNELIVKENYEENEIYLNAKKSIGSSYDYMISPEMNLAQFIYDIGLGIHVSQRHTPVGMPVEFVKTNEKLSNFTIANVLTKSGLFVTRNGRIYRYLHERGIYVKLSKDDADLYVRRTVNDELKEVITSQRIREIIQWMRSDVKLALREEEIEKNELRYIVFLNGTYDLMTGLLMMHNKNYFLTRYIRAAYQQYSVGSTFTKFVHDASGGNPDFVLRLQEIMGLVLSNIRNLKKIILFIGEKHTGKTTLTNLLMHMVGREHCSTLTLQQIGQHFKTAQLYEKALNISGENSEMKESDANLLKAASGNDMLTAENKGEAPFQFINKALLIFCGNHGLKMRGGEFDEALKSRFVPLYFGNSIDESRWDLELDAKLAAEADYIACWSLFGLKRLMDNNGRFTEVRGVSTDEVLDEDLKHFSDFMRKTYSFVSNNCAVPTSDIRDAYEKYCLSYGFNPVTEPRMHNYLRKNFNLPVGRSDDKRRGYKNLQVKQIPSIMEHYRYDDV